MNGSVERAYVVSLTIPDNEAFTALTTLGRMGLLVESIVRADVWVANVANSAAAEQLDAAIRTMETIFNPNKHKLEIRTATRPQAGEVWVTSRDEAPATTIAGRTIPGVNGIVRHTSWRLLDDRGHDVAPALLAKATATFLCNPAFQRAITA